MNRRLQDTQILANWSVLENGQEAIFGLFLVFSNNNSLVVDDLLGFDFVGGQLILPGIKS